MTQAERQRRWYANLTPEQREARRARQRKGFDHSETMSREARVHRAYEAGRASAAKWLREAIERDEATYGPADTWPLWRALR